MLGTRMPGWGGGSLLSSFHARPKRARACGLYVLYLGRRLSKLQIAQPILSAGELGRQRALVQNLFRHLTFWQKCICLLKQLLRQIEIQGRVGETGSAKVGVGSWEVVDGRKKGC